MPPYWRRSLWFGCGPTPGCCGNQLKREVDRCRSRLLSLHGFGPMDEVFTKSRLSLAICAHHDRRQGGFLPSLARIGSLSVPYDFRAMRGSRSYVTGKFPISAPALPKIRAPPAAPIKKKLNQQVAFGGSSERPSPAPPGTQIRWVRPTDTDSRLVASTPGSVCTTPPPDLSPRFR